MLTSPVLSGRMVGTNGWSLRKTQGCEQTWGVLIAQFLGGLLAVSKCFAEKAKDTVKVGRNLEVCVGELERLWGRKRG